MAETFRSFIAFDIEEEEILNNLVAVQQKLVETGAHLTLVKPENIHITMAFLGNVHVSSVESIYEAICQVDFQPFEVELSGVGVFPNPRRARVVWMGIREGVEQLERIFGGLYPQLQTFGLTKYTRRFSPHVTIARVKSSRKKTELVHCIDELVDWKFGLSKIRCLKLKKSVLTPRGPVYSILRKVCK